MWFNLYGVLMVLWTFVYLECEGTNANFNNQIREYATTDDDVNLTHGQVKTLQKQSIGLGRYASSAPIQNPIKFKEVPDSALSGSSYSRGLLHHSGYGYTDYDEPHYGHRFEYPIPDHHYNYHDIGHHHIGHGYGHGHHNHYNHALATKSLLLPIAGIALLGAAAALVTNPVLFQLGVVSGRRRRRHTDANLDTSLRNQTDTADFMKNSLKIWSQNTNDNEQDKTNTMSHKAIKKRVLKTINFEKPKQILRKTKYVQSIHSRDYNDDDEGRRFIPIPLKYRSV